ncbi:hypothetical protein L211DRAFT_845926 [Terfezia boudieri ATCC MYA-4762]|uniref:Uncharacterized protein n=1 Tax=Terfezia boudieri ATCC MYA-4762 TaxID=1051890 RepID=A0A3N4LYG5_9PEZI|nr:hypothetical protein L211DRAFT_845926 [Terfezia boudieri ATCC MYA-4762]
MEPGLNGYAIASFTIKATYNGDKNPGDAKKLDPETKLKIVFEQVPSPVGSSTKKIRLFVILPPAPDKQTWHPVIMFCPSGYTLQQELDRSRSLETFVTDKHKEVMKQLASLRHGKKETIVISRITRTVYNSFLNEISLQRRVVEIDVPQPRSAFTPLFEAIGKRMPMAAST